MKTGNKKFIAGLLAGLILATSLSVMAQTVAPQIVKARISVDGKKLTARDTIRVIEIPGDDGGLFIEAEPIFQMLTTKDLVLSGTYDAKTKVYDLTTKPPFENGAVLRECLGNLDSNYKIKVGDDDIKWDPKTNAVTITLTLNKNKATITYNSATDKTGVVTFNKKTAEFRLYVAEGTTYIIEQSLVDALIEVGFIK